MVRAAPRAHLRLGARASRRSRAARAAGAAVRDARSVPRGARARSSGGHRRPLGHAVPRRGLSRSCRRSIRRKDRNGTRSIILNVADGNFPSEFSTGRSDQIEEERRLLYVAMTRAKNDLHLIAPLKYYVANQPKHGDRHVYGARSRFLTKAVMAKLDAITWPEDGDSPACQGRARRASTSQGNSAACGHDSPALCDRVLCAEAQRCTRARYSHARASKSPLRFRISSGSLHTSNSFDRSESIS